MAIFGPGRASDQWHSFHTAMTRDGRSEQVCPGLLVN
jgi:hypothetical protein